MRQKPADGDNAIWASLDRKPSRTYSWRGPDRRPGHRPVIATGATRPPERDAEASTTLQIKWASASPRRRWPYLPAEGSLIPTVTVGQENNADIEIYYEDHGAGQPVVLTPRRR